MTTMNTTTSPSIKIVLAGTKDSGKTTLLSALSIYRSNRIMVGEDLTFDFEGKERTQTRKFRTEAEVCFERGGNWFDATSPDEPPERMSLAITSGGQSYRISFCDFAGETFIGAYNSNNSALKKDVIAKFKTEINDANLVFIVISCRDILESQSSAFFFAYHSIIEKAAELHKERGVQIQFVITQCDQCKALLSTDEGKELINNCLGNLIMSRLSSYGIDKIYISSVYQTRLKKVGKGGKLKFFPTEKSMRDKDEPSSLGLDKILDLICNVAANVYLKAAKAMAAKENRKRDELGSARSCAIKTIEKAKLLLGNKKKFAKDYYERLFAAVESLEKNLPTIGGDDINQKAASLEKLCENANKWLAKPMFLRMLIICFDKLILFLLCLIANPVGFWILVDTLIALALYPYVIAFLVWMGVEVK